MALLPAVVPQLVEKRSELVPARLARKVAALFGVPSGENPYGPLTWVCDFTTITVTEIARGAPLPTRAAAAHRKSAFVRSGAPRPRPVGERRNTR